MMAENASWDLANRWQNLAWFGLENRKKISQIIIDYLTYYSPPFYLFNEWKQGVTGL